MWQPPWATKTVPSLIISPSSASLTVKSLFSSNRRANGPVNSFGICCTTSIPAGTSFGREDRMDCTAFGPPVEDPIITTLVDAWGAVEIFFLGFNFSIFLIISLFGSASTAIFIFEIRVCFNSLIFSGFAWETGTKSSAPFSNASKTSLAPSWVKLLTTIIGINLSCLTSSSIKVSPSIVGISKSSKITSGFFMANLRRASAPSLAVFVTWIFALLTRSVSSVVIYLESFTIQTSIWFSNDFVIIVFSTSFFHWMW